MEHGSLRWDESPNDELHCYAEPFETGESRDERFSLIRIFTIFLFLGWAEGKSQPIMTLQ
jgi:hypothetical protein